MREHPWNIRRTSHIHVLAMQMLSDLHTLTLDGLADLQIDIDQFIALAPQSRDTLLLKGLEKSPELLWDDTLPEDLLTRLKTQIITLQSLLSKRSIKDGTYERLLKSVETSGAKCARARWPDLRSTDLRNIIATLKNHPASLLVRRATPNEVLIQFRNCSHADGLCDLQFHWIQGYAAALCSDKRLKVTRVSSEPCVQRWVL